MRDLERNSIRFTAIASFLAVILFFTFFFMSFLQRQVYNYDFWWHLATGKLIIENKALPEADPFSYTTHETPSSRKTVILKGYWLAQVIFYKIYENWDIIGIIMLRAICMTLFLFFVFLAIKKQGLSDLPSLLILTGVFIISMGYLGEIPQLFTMLFFSITLYILEDFRLNRTKKIFLIPPMMVLLSNMHPGYIVCILLLSIYVIGEGVNFLIRKGRDKKSFINLLIVGVSAPLLSLINPYGFKVIEVLILLEEHAPGIVAHMSPFTIYASKFKPVDYSYVLFLFLSLGNLLYWKKNGIVPLLVVSAFAALSSTGLRYIVFFMSVSAPFIASVAANLREEKPVKRFLSSINHGHVIVSAAVFFAGAFLVLSSIPKLAKYEFKTDTSFSAPKDAADFITPLKISGNMFNEYGFGGYLIWRLYPGKKVFIDGRSLDPDVYKEYNVIAAAMEEQGRSWEDIMRKYNISYIISPPLLPRGEIIPIVEKALWSDDWALIYRDQLSLIFLRKADENMPLIHQFGMDKKEALNTIIVQASARAKINSANPYYLITLGKVFLKSGRLSDAEKAFEMAYQRDPHNPIIREWLLKIRETKERTGSE